jgi:hypothetical protein
LQCSWSTCRSRGRSPRNGRYGGSPASDSRSVASSSPRSGFRQRQADAAHRGAPGCEPADRAQPVRLGSNDHPRQGSAVLPFAPPLRLTRLAFGRRAASRRHVSCRKCPPIAPWAAARPALKHDKPPRLRGLCG